MGPAMTPLTFRHGMQGCLHRAPHRRPACVPASHRLNLLGCTTEQLRGLLRERRQPAFRAKQIHDWIYAKGVADFERMTNLPLQLRTELQEHATVGSMRVEQERVARDGTLRRLWRLQDGRHATSMLIPRWTACISSEVSQDPGYSQSMMAQNLSSAEMFEQAAQFALELKAGDEGLSNAVFTGDGEPLRNLDAVLEAARQMQIVLGIEYRDITIATAGLSVVPELRRFSKLCATERLGIRLAVSPQRAATSAESVLTASDRHPGLLELVDACHQHVEHCGARLTFEWTLVEGQNDSYDEARALGGLLHGLRCHVNIISPSLVHTIGGSQHSMATFVEQLGKLGVPATARAHRGRD